MNHPYKKAFIHVLLALNFWTPYWKAIRLNIGIKRARDTSFRKSFVYYIKIEWPALVEETPV